MSFEKWFNEERKPVNYTYDVEAAYKAGFKANKEGLNGIVCECMTSCGCLERKIEKAEKWEALINSERLRVIGTGNLGGHHQHLGIEIWDKYPGAFEASEPSRKVLTDYVDTIIKRAR